jgi:hypothetical protein
MRKTTPSKQQIQALTDANVGLQASKSQLERAIADLKTTNGLLEQKIKLLEVAVTILLASSASLSTGLAIRMVGATAQTAFSSATGVFFAVIVASIAILSFMRR